jgi:hypothetical protein
LLGAALMGGVRSRAVSRCAQSSWRFHHGDAHGGAFKWHGWVHGGGDGGDGGDGDGGDGAGSSRCVLERVRPIRVARAPKIVCHARKMLISQLSFRFLLGGQFHGSR